MAPSPILSGIPWRQDLSLEINEEPAEFSKHVVVGRNYVDEILYDAYVEICSLNINGKSYPRTMYAAWHNWQDEINLISDSGMMATGITDKRQGREPRFKNLGLESESV